MLRGPRPNAEDLATDARHRWRTLLDVLEGAVESAPRRGVYIIDARGNQEFRTYAQILEAALRIGAALEGRGVKRGDRILLVVPTSYDFLSTFFGAIAIQAVPVPVAPPRADIDSSDRAEYVVRIAERLSATTALFSTTETDAARPPQYKKLKHVIDLAQLLDGVPIGAAPKPPTSRPEIAYLQTTSGATGTRRAVELTHANILTNLHAIGQKLQVDAQDVSVSWLPLHNLLGLVGAMCFSMYWALDAVLIDTERFLKRPEEWLQVFTRHRGTLSVAPSFGYHYAVRRCQESNLEGVDLSSWRIAITGGEAVRPEHMRAFTRRFGRYGFREEVFMPVYGLAEATLGVAFAEPDNPPQIDRIDGLQMERGGVARPVTNGAAARALEFVAVGQPLPGIDVMIVDSRGVEVEERVLGEVAVRGPNVTPGYVEAPHRPASGESTRFSNEWLMTGDLGYVADGRLYVVGRVHDRIAGSDDRQLLPEELERELNAIDGVRSGGAAAFGIPDQNLAPRERLVVAVEVQAGVEPSEVEASIKARLQRRFAVTPDEIHFLSPHSLPKSPNGKIRRHLLRYFYEHDALDRRARSVEFDGVRRLLQRSRHELLKLGQQVIGELRRLVRRD